jgi:hypothetical protein
MLKAMLFAAAAVPGIANMQPSVLSVPIAAETYFLMGLSCARWKKGLRLERNGVCSAALRRSTAGGQLARLTFGLERSPTI